MSTWFMATEHLSVAIHRQSVLSSSKEQQAMQALGAKQDFRGWYGTVKMDIQS